MAESLLALRDICVRHGGRTVLEVPRLEIEPGEVLALLGPNGAGKTTLLKVIGLLQLPDAGTVCFKGEVAGSQNALAIRRRIANVFQEPLLLNTTIYQNAALGLRLRGLSREQIDARLKVWLDRLGIAALAARGARTLSGGEAQRTSLARAFAVEPELLLLDEPFSELDPASRESLLRDFQRIVKETGTTAVFVTHDRDEAYALADRVALLQEGRTLQIGSRDDVFLRPVSAAAAEIVGVENRLAGVVLNSAGDRVEISIGGGRLCATGCFESGAAVVACIRAELVLLGGISRNGEMANRLKGRVTEISPGINRHRIGLDCGGLRLVALIDRRAWASLELSAGVEREVVVEAAAVHVIAANRRA